MVGAPKIIYLDEPTSGLDGNAALVVMRCMGLAWPRSSALLCPPSTSRAPPFGSSSPRSPCCPRGACSTFGAISQVGVLSLTLCFDTIE